MTTTKEEFREEQRQKASAQNLHSDNAVPEQRPQASQQVDSSRESETYRRLKKSGKLQEEPMDKAAYDKADSKEQAKKAKKAERVVPLEVGARVIITDGEYEGSYASILKPEYKDFTNEQLAKAGTEESRFAEVVSYQVRTRGGRHALVEVKPNQIRRITDSEWGNRGES